MTIFLAGRLYREGLLEWAGRRFFVPMAGLSMGEQKRWLIRRLGDAGKVAEHLGAV